MKQALLFIQSIFGAIRSTIGHGLLNRNCKKSSNLTDSEFYRKNWDYAQNISWLLAGRELHANRFHLKWEIFAVDRIRKHVSTEPKLSVVIDENVEALADPIGSIPSIILCIHCHLIFEIAQAARNVGYDPIVVREKSKRRDASSHSFTAVEREKKTPILLTDNNLFLNIRKSIKAGNSIIALVDFTARRANTLYHDRYFSTALIEFALRSKTQILFASATVKQDGGIHITFKQPEITNSETTPFQIAEQYKTFFQRTTKLEASWEIVNSPQEVQLLKHQFKDLALRPEMKE